MLVRCGNVWAVVTCGRFQAVELVTPHTIYAGIVIPFQIEPADLAWANQCAASTEPLELPEHRAGPLLEVQAAAAKIRGALAAAKSMVAFANAQALGAPPGPKVCATCGKRSRKLCPCRCVRYCCRACQTEGWPAHKLVCPAAKH